MNMTEEAEKAVANLQSLASKTADLRTQERSERAIDEIIRHPENRLPEQHQRKNALRHALWDQMRKATKQAPPASLDDPLQFQSAVDGATAFDEPGFGVSDIFRWLMTSGGLRESDRDLLLALAEGYDADILASIHRVPVKRMRERISRSRARGWSVYVDEVLTA